jgi:hypothetical protein
MASIVLAIEWLVAHLTSGSLPHSRVALSWQYADQSARGRESKCDIICLGDSLVKLGILPRVLEAGSGASACNLAILGGQAPSSFILLRRVLEHGHRPRAVVVDFSALMMAATPAVNPDGWALLAEGRDLLDFAWRARAPGVVLAIATRRLCPTWRERELIREAVESGFWNGLDAATAAQERRVFERNWRINRGAQVAPRGFVLVEGSLSDPDTWKWKPHPVNVLYVERFLRLAERHRLQVVWLLPPATAAWRRRHRASGVLEGHEQFVRRCAARFSGVTVFDAQELDWDASAFRDPIHLNRDGAVALSLAVGSALSSCIGNRGRAPRWVVLATPSPGAISAGFQDALEDLDQSRLAVCRTRAPARLDGRALKSETNVRRDHRGPT